MSYPPTVPTVTAGDRNSIDTTGSSGSIHRVPQAEIAAADTSLQAIKFLLASFIIECLVWSFPNAYGVFYDYYLSHTTLGQSKDAQFLLSLSGTCQSGVMYCSSPLVFYFQRRFPQYFKPSLWIGLVLLSISLIITSFANAPYQFLLLQGFLYAIGGTLLYYSSFALIPEWFVRRRGLATGVCFAGTSVGGIFLPFLVTVLLNSYGEKTTLRALGIAIFVLLAPVLSFIEPRVPFSSPKSSMYQRPRQSNRPAWWKNSILWIYAVATISQALGYFVTTLYLPTFATSLGLSNLEGTGALALLNASGTIARLASGVLADYFPPFRIAAISLTLSGLAAFLIWGLAATTFGALMAFSTVFGLAATGFTSLASGVIKDLAGEDPSISVILFGFLTFVRGLGNVLTSPISTALLKNTGSSPDPHPSTVYQTSFSSIVILAGGTMALAGLLSTSAGILQWRRQKKE